MSIIVQGLDIKVGIRSQEVKDFFLHVTTPVFPADVPALNENLVKAMVGGKVDITAHIGIVGRMTSRRTGTAIVGLSQFYRGIVIGIVPIALARNHFPPHANVLGGMDPTGILDFAGLIQIKNETRSEHLARIIGDENRAPGSVARRLQIAFHALGIGSKVGNEGVAVTHEFKVHGRIIH